MQGDKMRTELCEGQKTEWLTKLIKIVGSEEVIETYSWASFHAGQTSQLKYKTAQSQILYFPSSKKHQIYLPM